MLSNFVVSYNTSSFIWLPLLMSPTLVLYSITTKMILTRFICMHKKISVRINQHLKHNIFELKLFFKIPKWIRWAKIYEMSVHPEESCRRIIGFIWQIGGLRDPSIATCELWMRRFHKELRPPWCTRVYYAWAHIYTLYTVLSFKVCPNLRTYDVGI
jgi:hypothetical protein